MNTHFSENRMLALRGAPLEGNDAPPTVSQAPTESKKATRSWLGRNWGKLAAVLGIGLAAAGTYGLGKAGLGGHLANGADNMFMRNSPDWLKTTARQVSSVAGTRFVNLVDHGIFRQPAIGATGFPADHVRKNIAEGRGIGED